MQAFHAQDPVREKTGDGRGEARTQEEGSVALCQLVALVESRDGKKAARDVCVGRVSTLYQSNMSGTSAQPLSTPAFEMRRSASATARKNRMKPTSKENTRRQVRAVVANPCLEGSDEAEGENLQRDPARRSHTLEDDLGRDLEEDDAQVK